MNDSVPGVDILEEMEDNPICLANRTAPLMNLTHTNTHPWLQMSQNVTAENREIPANQTTNKTAGEKINKPSKPQESFVVFLGHYADDEPPGLMIPRLGNANHNVGFIQELLEAGKNDNVSPGSLDTIHVEKDDGEIYAWSESPPEFANVNFYGFFPHKTASEHHDGLDIAGFNSNGNPTQYVSREPLVEEKEAEESWPQENSGGGTALRMRLDESNTSAPADKQRLWVLNDKNGICETADVNINNIAPPVSVLGIWRNMYFFKYLYCILLKILLI